MVTATLFVYSGVTTDKPFEGLPPFQGLADVALMEAITQAGLAAADACCRTGNYTTSPISQVRDAVRGAQVSMCSCAELHEPSRVI